MFNITEYLNALRNEINRALDANMPKASERPALLHKAMRHGVMAGGKRLRPIVCLAACGAVGGSGRNALMPALAIELFHAYTLIHDDLPCMDDSPVRRGKPSVHVAFGEANAVLAGDALQSLAFEWMASARPHPPYGPTDLVLELARAAGNKGVVAGQFEDLAVLGRTPGRDKINYIHLYKTAALFRASARIGGMAGGADKKELTALSAYGTKLGLAFQIVDDIKDADKSKITCRRSKRPQETTCLMTYGLAEASSRARRLVRDAQNALAPFGRRAAPLSAIADCVLGPLLRPH